jgi:hypothetical protein
MHGQHDLLEVVQVGDFARVVFGPAQHGQQQRRQNRNDGNDHQQFNQGERLACLHS